MKPDIADARIIALELLEERFPEFLEFADERAVKEIKKERNDRHMRDKSGNSVN